ncbi:MAG TPA: YceI family protein [Chitinophagaceae bacterium]|nr:YceI family protein [Chitinophagaceae bacterium]
MKQTVLLAAVLLATTTTLFTACSDAPKGDQATVSAKKEAAASTTGQSFAVDTTASAIRFIGNGVGKNHPGTFRLSNGNLSVAADSVTGGQFTINMATMQVEQPEEMFQTKLKGHLMGADFFDVSKWGTAKFELTDVKPFTAAGGDSSVVAGANHTVSGNFTLKGETKNISFPAKINVADNQVTALANFDIDRTQWGIRYGNDKSLGDKFISETVNIQLNLKAAK